MRGEANDSRARREAKEEPAALEILEQRAEFRLGGDDPRGTSGTLAAGKPRTDAQTVDAVVRDSVNALALWRRAENRSGES